MRPTRCPPISGRKPQPPLHARPPLGVRSLRGRRLHTRLLDRCGVFMHPLDKARVAQAGAAALPKLRDAGRMRIERGKRKPHANGESRTVIVPVPLVRRDCAPPLSLLASAGGKWYRRSRINISHCPFLPPDQFGLVFERKRSAVRLPEHMWLAHGFGCNLETISDKQRKLSHRITGQSRPTVDSNPVVDRWTNPLSPLSHKAPIQRADRRLPPRSNR